MFLSELIAGDAHLQTLHGGIQLTLGTVRRQFCILNGRSVVKRTINQCKDCKRFSSQQYVQLMGNLPRARITPSFPFKQSGVDYAGPVQVRLTKTKEKVL